VWETHEIIYLQFTNYPQPFGDFLRHHPGCQTWPQREILIKATTDVRVVHGGRKARKMLNNTYKTKPLS
jgi:hypothetical protein